MDTVLQPKQAAPFHYAAIKLLHIASSGHFAHQSRKELGCFHIIFAQILTAHNFCLTHITASILIYANALGYFLSIKIEFVMRNTSTSPKVLA